MELFDTVAETGERFDVKTFICKEREDMPQLMNLDALETAGMLDESEEKNRFGKIQDIPEKRFVVEENIFKEVLKTVQDIVATVTVLEEDILQPVMVMQDILETVTVIEEDILESLCDCRKTSSICWK
ncbi:unnamed protein product [Larinioides sclopetarius]|uniref:Uncharacterized protein n=1 Tax=Larinioides sclopetarius TaxID=280406 RepID=A0AAV1ZJR5_9ARAC